MKCPHCRSAVPGNAKTCACGYNFMTGNFEKSESESEDYNEGLEYEMARLQEEENLQLAIGVGLGVSIAAAIIWASITFITGYQIGFLAIGIGYLVGVVIKGVGKGVTIKFQMIGAALALFGCVLGDFITICYFFADQEKIRVHEVFSLIDPMAIPGVMISTASGMDVLFYAIAMFAGFKYSLREPTKQELADNWIPDSERASAPSMT